MQMKITPLKRKPRGQVLIMTAFLIFVLFTLAFSFFKLLPTELNSALRTKQGLTAQVIADSGIKEAKVWLESQPPQKILNQAILDSEFNAGTTAAAIPMGDTWTDGASPDEVVGRWRYDVKLTRNLTAPYAYDAVSTCYFEDQPMRQARATLARENFSRYALFIDRWDPSLIMEPAAGAIQGPFHTNDFFRLMIRNDFYTNGGDPFVSGVNGVMTHAGATGEGTLPFVGDTGDGNAYYDTSNPQANSSEGSVPYSETGEISSRYDALVAGGRSNLTATDHVLLPYSADELLVQSLGGEDASSVTIPSEIGLYVPEEGGVVKGGIFIVGDVDVRLSINGDGDQVHTYTQNIPERAYRYITQETVSVPVYGNVSRTLGVGDTYYQSSTVTQQVDVQVITGYETQTVTTTRQEQTGQQYVTSGSGSGTTVGSWQPVYTTVTDTSEVQVPIYETQTESRPTTVTNGITISDPNDPMIGSTVDSYEVVDHVDQIRDRVNEVDEDTYEANPGAYPGASLFLRPGPPKTATLTEEAGENPKTTWIDYEGATHNLSGALNGVTFVDGNVASIEGVSKGAQHPDFPDGDVFQGRYIVANPAFASKGKLTVTNDLLQFYDGDSGALRGAVPNTLKVGELSPNSQHSLGIVSKETFLKPAANDELNIYAVMLAGRSLRGTENENGIPQVDGGFGSHESILSAGYGTNIFNLYGGLVQANQRLWSSGDDGLRGNFTYDPAVAGDLPRFPRSNKVTTLRYADRYVDQDSI
jgi:hypothetical protein